MCSKCVGKWSFAAHDAAHFNLTKRNNPEGVK